MNTTTYAKLQEYAKKAEQLLKKKKALEQTLVDLEPGRSCRVVPALVHACSYGGGYQRDPGLSMIPEDTLRETAKQHLQEELRSVIDDLARIEAEVQKGL